jgi:hypothetical protein
VVSRATEAKLSAILRFRCRSRPIWHVRLKLVYLAFICLPNQVALLLTLLDSANDVRKTSTPVPYGARIPTVFNPRTPMPLIKCLNRYKVSPFGPTLL